MTLYLDTSLLVTAFAHEPATERAIKLLKSSPDGTLMVSEWVTTEFAAALSIKVRTRQITEAYQAQAAALFAKSLTESMHIVQVTTAHFNTAAQFAGRHKLGLCAGDALHLAIAGDHNATLCTLDKRLAEAGATLGISTRLI